jgi:predicted NAD/FAD-dependent oxidoreductase
MATRYNDHTEFDHGAQFFTVRRREFEQFLAPYSASFAEWNASITTLSPQSKAYKRLWFEPHYVSTPRMNSLCKHIATGLTTHLAKKIIAVSGLPGHWFLETDDTLYGPFDWVISTAPAPQTCELLNVADQRANYDPTFALMVPIEQHPGFDAAVVKDSPISWLAVNSTKPQRCPSKSVSLTAHASPDWSKAHLDEPLQAVKMAMLDALAQLSVGRIDAEQAQAHLWRYARVCQPAGDPFYLDVENGLAACGDWGVGSTVEDAFLSALDLFSTIQTRL